jgi:hypothetical protein
MLSSTTKVIFLAVTMMAMAGLLTAQTAQTTLADQNISAKKIRVSSEHATINIIVNPGGGTAQKGEKGDRGERGPPGQSIVGPAGGQGPQGEPGKSIIGPPGKNGINGTNGTNGKDGVTSICIQNETNHCIPILSNANVTVTPIKNTTNPTNVTTTNTTNPVPPVNNGTVTPPTNSTVPATNATNPSNATNPTNATNPSNATNPVPPVNVTKVKDTLTVSDVNASTSKNTPVTIALKAEDSNKTVRLGFSPNQGKNGSTAAVNGTDSVIYTPKGNFTGKDSFTYNAWEWNDHSIVSNNATVSVLVTEASAPPLIPPTNSTNATSTNATSTNVTNATK